jgi:tryptophan synthase alpha chain
MTSPAQRLADAIRHPKHPGLPAVMPYVTSGYPTRDGFAELVLGLSEVSDAIEIGVPFSDPMADGPVIQRSSRIALDGGASLAWILETLTSLPRKPACPLVLMSYANPLMAFGYERLVDAALAAGVCGFIVPDMPWEESEAFRALIASRGLASIQLVTPVTPDERLSKLGQGEGGFVYAVTVTGITGAAMEPAEISSYLDRVRSLTGKPVCAGFGIRTAAHVRGLSGHADGAIVGTALIEALGRGEDGVAFVRALLA